VEKIYEFLKLEVYKHEQASLGGAYLGSTTLRGSWWTGRCDKRHTPCYLSHPIGGMGCLWGLKSRQIQHSQS